MCVLRIFKFEGGLASAFLLFKRVPIPKHELPTHQFDCSKKKWGEKCGLRDGCDRKELVIMRAKEPVGGPCPRDRAIEEGQAKPWERRRRQMSGKDMMRA